MSADAGLSYCYQNFPDILLPAALKQDNPLNLWRQVDGKPLAPRR
ncbi:hypothetical protein [Pseudomonas taetrolens]